MPKLCTAPAAAARPKKRKNTIDAGGPLVLGNRVVHLKLGCWFVCVLMVV